MEDGSVYSFGRDGSGQLGLGRGNLVVSEPKKVHIRSAEKAVKVSAGDAHVLLSTENGKVFSWGDGQQGQLGHGTNTDIYVPQEIDHFDIMFFFFFGIILSLKNEYVPST